MSEEILDNYSHQISELMSKIADLNREVGVIKAHQDSFSKQFSSKLDEISVLCKKNDAVLDDLVKKSHLSQTLYGWLARNWLQVGCVAGFVIIEVLYNNIKFPNIS